MYKHRIINLLLFNNWYFQEKFVKNCSQFLTAIWNHKTLHSSKEFTCLWWAFLIKS